MKIVSDPIFIIYVIFTSQIITDVHDIITIISTLSSNTRSILSYSFDLLRVLLDLYSKIIYSFQSIDRERFRFDI